ncbi:iron chelate uptake ABC transporter family permease subunit [Arenibaculum pallidiluteum]|uniref:iron chelate uptake ABC transporter family permease subunit n=1 Tax=Arenibaculum pallidiluteum TaxID=2812559 RepID=UPI001F17D515|nr:iron chelate uptake ABC transporter family permease subunit [Arenibaculum pallidiluteum]
MAKVEGKTSERAAPLGQRAVLLALVLLAAAATIAFMTLGARGRWDLVLAFRGPKLGALILVGLAIAVSTVLFQTVTENRILTPAIMGFDSLYVLIQSAIVFLIGTQGFAAIDPRFMFAAQAAVMVAFSALLYAGLFATGRRNLHLLVLAGVVMGGFFRSLSTFIQRVIDPNEFSFLQNRFFASFNSIDTDLLAVGAVAVIAASAVALRMARVLDVLALGRERAICLGVDHRRAVSRILVLVAVLVSVSTALTGPVTFFGLLVANLAHVVTGSSRHRVLLPAASLLAIVFLVGGQTIVERVFAFETNLRVIVDFVGGIVFLAMLLRGKT